ncbi:hypothetical protein RIEGSTA812A_PEG_1249 [invertebrate metagenome]|uniref:Lipopolysaccharide export system protein LptC n=1 Tax=invertebrate metagenome TaxID=1711999 RepID=A0A484H6K9_9ZZZZ
MIQNRVDWYNRSRCRRSFCVFLIKICLLGLAVSAASLIIVWPQLSNREPPFAFAMTGLSSRVKIAAGITNARYYVSSDNDCPISINSEFMYQTLARKINILFPIIDFLQKNNTQILLEADRGWYDYECMLLHIENNMHIFYDESYILRTDVAHIDIEDGNSFSHSPITGYGALGTLTGEGLHILDRGDTVALTGQSRLLLNLSPTPPPQI